MGELMFRVTGKEGGTGLSLVSSHPLTEDRLARMDKADCSPPGGPAAAVVRRMAGAEGHLQRRRQGVTAQPPTVPRYFTSRNLPPSTLIRNAERSS